MHHPTDRIAHTTAFVTPVMEHWLEQEIDQWVHPTKDRSDDPSHQGAMMSVDVFCVVCVSGSHDVAGLPRGADHLPTRAQRNHPRSQPGHQTGRSHFITAVASFQHHHPHSQPGHQTGRSHFITAVVSFQHHHPHSQPGHQTGRSLQ